MAFREGLGPIAWVRGVYMGERGITWCQRGVHRGVIRCVIWIEKGVLWKRQSRHYNGRVDSRG